MKKKLILSALLGACLLVSGNIFALVGTAVREVANYASGKAVINDSNNVVFTIDEAGEYSNGLIRPGKAYYNAKNDIEIKQNTGNPTTITAYDKSGTVIAEYQLSDLDWRVWFVKDWLRTQNIALDKTHLKALYHAYRRGLIIKPFKMLVNFITELIGSDKKDDQQAKSKTDKALAALGTLDTDEIMKLTEKPPSKDARLYILPDGSILMGPDSREHNLNERVQAIVDSNPVLSEGQTYADLVNDEKALTLFTPAELEDMDKIDKGDEKALDKLLEEAIDEFDATPEEAKKALEKVIEGETDSQAIQIFRGVDPEGAN